MVKTFQTRHFQWAICNCCHGNGGVDHPAFANGFTSEEWDDMGQDWDCEGETTGQDRYLSGAYDVPCDECNGSGKVRQPIFQAMSRDERRAYVRFLREQRQATQYAYEQRAEYEAERRMGA